MAAVEVTQAQAAALAFYAQEQTALAPLLSAESPPAAYRRAIAILELHADILAPLLDMDADVIQHAVEAGWRVAGQAGTA